MQVKLTYYKKSGSFYTFAFYKTEHAALYKIIEEVEQMRATKTLPGVTGNNFTVLIEPQNGTGLSHILL